jgi:hypothetical protein
MSALQPCGGAVTVRPEHTAGQLHTALRLSFVVAAGKVVK